MGAETQKVIVSQAVIQRTVRSLAKQITNQLVDRGIIHLKITDLKAFQQLSHHSRELMGLHTQVHFAVAATIEPAKTSKRLSPNG